MLDFLKMYWREIASLICLVLSILFFIFKKPVSSSFDADVTSNLVVLLSQWIQKVEVPGNGDYKKSTVINLALRYIRKQFGRELDEDETLVWTKRVSTLIELFLETPSKKRRISNENETCSIKKS